MNETKMYNRIRNVATYYLIPALEGILTIITGLII